MATKAIGLVTDMTYGSSDVTKTDISVLVIGLESWNLVKGGITVPDVDMASATVAPESVILQAIKDQATNGYGYTFGGNDDVRCFGIPKPRAASAASRSLNSAFQISAIRDTVVSYSIDVACTLSITGGQTGTVFLEYADNSGMSTNVVEVCRSVNGNTGTLTIGLNITQSMTGVVSGIIPAGKYVRIRTANTTGTPAFAWRSGQEALL